MRTLYGASKDQRIAARYIPKGSTKITAKADGVSCVYVYQSAGRFYAIAYRGTAARSEFHHSYRTDAQRVAHVNAFLDSVKQSHERRAQRRAAKSAWVNPLTAGDILHTSWGYDQTNTEFFAVTRVSGRRVWIREIAAAYTATGDMSGRVRPAMPVQFVGEETMHTAQPLDSDRGVYVKISSCRDAWPVEAGRDYHVSSYA